ncbi:MAG: hypothetical protein WDM90_01090 [Ferruginibacter sp.]
MTERKKYKSQPKPAIQTVASNIITVTDDFVLNQKTEMLMKDYDSAFAVYGREETIVYNFRTWTITLISAYIGFLLNKTQPVLLKDSTPGFIIIFIFYILEVSERSVMKRIVEEVRKIETIFMITSDKKLKAEIIAYKFRDIRDGERKFLKYVWDFMKAFFAMQVFWWFIFTLIVYTSSLLYITHTTFFTIFR